MLDVPGRVDDKPKPPSGMEERQSEAAFVLADATLAPARDRPAAEQRPSSPR
jgi:hypothetical protein